MRRPSLDDNLTETGAHRLAEAIRASWRNQGIEVEVRVERAVLTDTRDPTPNFVVRSNLGALLSRNGA
jgi:hypothetical protein